jgi:RsiW-degrading membrane proteinase PrsW (M82 family)
MKSNSAKPGKFWPFIALIAGFFLLFSGLLTLIGYLGLPFVLPGEDVLGPQLGQMAGLFLGLICGTLAVYHGLRSLADRPSGRLKSPPAYTFWIAFALVLGLGNVWLNFPVATVYIFPFLFLLGAALPVLSVVAYAARRLGWPVTWRQGSMALVTGSTLSVWLAILLEIAFLLLIFALVPPLGFLGDLVGGGIGAGGADLFERLFFSPALIIFLVFTVLQAPIPEEFTKGLGVVVFGRRRLTNERQVLLVGLMVGAGFAIMENMLYEGVVVQVSGWSWGGVTLLRGLGAVLHPVCTGLVALGWFRVQERGVGQLLKAYAIAVGLHTLWNGGFSALVYLSGYGFYANPGPSISLYGTAVGVALVVFLTALAAGMWWLLHHLVGQYAHQARPRIAPAIVSQRALAVWAVVCALVIIPIGAALGPAWDSIHATIRSVLAG